MDVFQQVQRMGFLVPRLVTAVTWRYAFMILAVWPAVGIMAMGLLRRSKRGELMGNGN